MEQTSSETEALRRARLGDASAFGLLVQNHQEAAFRAAYLILHDAQAAEDMAQEGFVRAYRQLHRFREEDPFRPWLLRIVMNLALNETRRRKRGLALLERFGREAPRREPGPESVTLATEGSREVWQAINRLAQDDRVILYLRYFLELSEADMARVIERPAGTVKSRLHRAGRRLRAVIEREYPHLRMADD
jgi:RNA polymerase sigma-70 factor (ECF subfamily)